MIFPHLRKKLNLKAALADGSLLEDVELDGDNVKLLLKEEYNHPDYYISINFSLYNLYKTSPAFQAKFEQPKQGKGEPCLKLKPDHGYVEGQSVLNVLVGLATPKEKFKLNVKAALAKGSLLERVELDGDNVKLQLKEEYNHSDNYVSINQALLNLYKASPAFQAKFAKPKKGKSVPCLKLMLNHGYADDQAVRDALVGFAASKDKLNIREILAEGSLLEDVELDGDNVKLLLKEKYHNLADYTSINNTLSDLYKTSQAFQAQFEQPEKGNSAPCLKLKPDHGFVDGKSVQDALVSFAVPKEKLNVKAALAAGSLLEGVELDGENVKLLFKEEYNHSDSYASINQALYSLYKRSPAFQAKFERPKKGKSVPCLKLKLNHGYADDQAVQDALVSFVSSKKQRKVKTVLGAVSSPKEKLNVKETLAAGNLLERVELDGDNVKLLFKEEYNNPDYYFSINHALYNLYKVSLAFQAKFEQPKAGNSVPCLNLKSNHGYADSQSVQDALIAFAAPKEKQNVKDALAEGSLLERVELDGDNVKLILKEKYNNPADYVSINRALYALHKASPAFQAKFEQPKAGNSVPHLKLKSTHGYANSQSVQDALIAFAAPKEKQNVKEALAAGSLLERVDLNEDNAELILKEEYNHPDYYVPINRALYKLFKASTPFQAKFEHPMKGNGAPYLKLKTDHGYADAQSVQDALISFAAFKDNLNVKATLADGSLLEGVELYGDNVKLLLKEEYNHPDYYVSINKALYNMYKASAAFQAKFEQPKTENSAPCLKLKTDHGYADGKSVQDVLVGFAASKEKFNVKATLAAGSLLERVDLNEDNAKLILKEEYDHLEHYISINHALYTLYRASPAFQDKFKQPKKGKRAPSLKLKSNHGYAEGQSVLDALISFAAIKPKLAVESSPKEKLNVKAVLAEGSLLERVELDGENVKLLLKEKYNHSDYYSSINHALQNLYKVSKAFQAKFEQPKRLKGGAPCLKLKSDHGYAEAQSVQDALISFAAKEKLNVKAALAAGELLEEVELDGDNIRLILKEKYNNQACYLSISQALNNLYKTSPAFQAKFALPKTGKGVPFLELKPDHGYADGQSVQDALVGFAAPKEKLNVKEDLIAGSLLERVELDGDNVSLILKEKYNIPDYYVSINKFLYELHNTSSTFQTKFEQPQNGNGIPCLKLKPNHGYADAQSVKDALISFPSKGKLSVKVALAEGSLLEGVELEEANVRLILKERYNYSEHYLSISHALKNLYKASPAFQAKFARPKTRKGVVPSLELKPDHGYLDSQSVQDALISFAAPKEMLNVKATLGAGNLLEGVDLVDDNVRLILKEKHNNLADYVSINYALYNLFKMSLPFQDKFEQPKAGNHAPCLKLKANHGYIDSQSVHDALIDFSSAKEKLNIKGSLAAGNLLEGVELDGDNVKLLLKEEYNNPEYYVSINKALYVMYKASKPFKAKFEQPKQGNGEPCLKLKPDHGYADGQSVQDALIDFASAKEKLNIKGALAAGSLLEGVELDGDNVKLLLKGNYNHSDYYTTINYALLYLHKSSSAFQDKFEQPKAGNNAPCLKLKTNHGYIDGSSVKDALVGFAATKEKPNFKEILKEGSLLEDVELNGDNVKLILKEKYNEPDYYDSINDAFYAAHQTSLAFQAKFEQPKQGNSEPSLKLKPNHGYIEEQSVKDALISFTAPKEMLTVKEALAAGSLLEGVEMEGDNVELLLKEEYDNPEYYASINQALYKLHKASPTFQAKFEQPERGEIVPCLILKPDHGYADSQSVQGALISFAAPKERLNIKAALAAGNFLEGVEQNGDNVRLILKEKYNNPADYFSISQALCHLYKASLAFQAKFEQPKAKNSAPCLILKPGHGYADVQSMQDALIGFAASKDKLNVKEDLIEGSLLERVELDGNSVKLLFKEKYNSKANYAAINYALYALYKTSPAFQAKFSQPKLGKSKPCLELKPNHGYADSHAVQDALIGFASPDLAIPSPTFLPGFRAVSANQGPTSQLLKPIYRSR